MILEEANKSTEKISLSVKSMDRNIGKEK